MGMIRLFELVLDEDRGPRAEVCPQQARREEPNRDLLVGPQGLLRSRGLTQQPDVRPQPRREIAGFTLPDLYGVSSFERPETYVHHASSMSSESHSNECGVRRPAKTRSSQSAPWRSPRPRRY